MKFHCYCCHRIFQAEQFNMSRITVECPVCATPNRIDQAVGRVYGKKAGIAIEEILTALQKMCDKSRKGTADLSKFIWSAYARVVAICEQAEEAA